MRKNEKRRAKERGAKRKRARDRDVLFDKATREGVVQRYPELFLDH